jgi:hypothetical protein
MSDRAAMPGAAFRIGSVISRGVSTYFRNIVSFLILSVIAFLPAIVVTVIFGAMVANVESVMREGEGPSAGLILGIVLWVLAFVLGWLWLSAGITYGVIASLRQGKINLGEVMATSLKSVLPLLGLGVIIMLIMMGLGLLVLIPFLGIIVLFVLGLYLMVRWWVAIPAVVVESIGPIAALGRASELTKGNRWSVLGVMVLWGLVAGLVGTVVITLLSLAAGVPLDAQAAPVDAGAGGVVIQIVSGFVNLILAGLGASVVAVGYHDLRIAREGGDTEQIARAFD